MYKLYIHTHPIRGNVSIDTECPVDPTELPVEHFSARAGSRHVGAHCCGYLVEGLIAKPLFVAQTADGHTIADALIPEMFRAIARRMRTVDIAGLMVGAFVPVDELLELSRGG